MAGTTTLDESRHPHGESETTEPHHPTRAMSTTTVALLPTVP